MLSIGPYEFKGNSYKPIALCLVFINSVQTRCIVKGEAQKNPLFWRFSGGFRFSQDRLFSRNSTRKPLNLIKSPIFTNAPCKTACLYNAASMHTLDFRENLYGPMALKVCQKFPPRPLMNFLKMNSETEAAKTHPQLCKGYVLIGCTPRGSCNRTRLLEGFLEGSLTASAS